MTRPHGRVTIARGTDAEGTPYLDRQPDIADEQRAAADRIETTLRRSLRQAAPLPHGTRPAAVDKRKKKDQAQLELGRVANELYKTTQPAAIVAHPTFLAALKDFRKTTGSPLCIESGQTVLRYINRHRQAERLPPLPRGRQPSR